MDIDIKALTDDHINIELTRNWNLNSHISITILLVGFGTRYNAENIRAVVTPLRNEEDVHQDQNAEVMQEDSTESASNCDIEGSNNMARQIMRIIARTIRDISAAPLSYSCSRLFSAGLLFPTGRKIIRVLH